MRRIALLAAGFALCTGWTQTRPRAAAADYRVSQSASTLSAGAERLSPEEVRNAFTSPLARDYMVVEVALFPKDGARLDVSRLDFTLHCGTEPAVRAALPAAVAREEQHRNASTGRDVFVSPTVGVGYENGPYGRGVSTGVGVGIGVGGPGGSAPASTDADRRIMQRELEDKALPEGPAGQPVAGFLYFPVPLSKQKRSACDLSYFHAGEKILLFLK